MDVASGDQRETDPPVQASAPDDALPDVEVVDDAHDGDPLVLPWWQNPVNIIVIAVATALIAGMIGWLVGHSANEVASSDVDVGFLQDMRVHHEQAVLMSDIFLSRPEIDDQLVPVAQSIQFGQSIEIGIMLQLLRDMGAPTESDEGQAMAWMGMAPTDDEHMPGLATDEQLAELRAAKGSQANDLFIDLMVAHHTAGIDMANYAAEHGKNDDVRTYASAWAGSQTEEIAELEALHS
jgi:uncharacterized protein (DUF305 family)